MSYRRLKRHRPESPDDDDYPVASVPVERPESSDESSDRAEEEDVSDRRPDQKEQDGGGGEDENELDSSEVSSVDTDVSPELPLPSHPLPYVSVAAAAAVPPPSILESPRHRPAAVRPEQVGEEEDKKDPFAFAPAADFLGGLGGAGEPLPPKLKPAHLFPDEDYASESTRQVWGVPDPARDNSFAFRRLANNPKNRNSELGHMIQDVVSQVHQTDDLVLSRSLTSSWARTPQGRAQPLSDIAAREYLYDQTPNDLRAVLRYGLRSTFQILRRIHATGIACVHVDGDRKGQMDLSMSGIKKHLEVSKHLVHLVKETAHLESELASHNDGKGKQSFVAPGRA